jgi:hypothetical protein
VSNHEAHASKVYQECWSSAPRAPDGLCDVVSRDEQRIEEEIAGVHRPARPRNLSSTYLEQAADTLYAMGNPPSLYKPWPPPPARDDNQRQRAMMALAARRSRRVMGRTAVLFAALAAESYVNEFISAHIAADSRQYRTLDALNPVNKYLRGTHEAYGENLFFRDREPMQVIAALFEMRTKLVHPKPGFGPASWLDQDDDSEGEFAPAVIAEYVISVGGAGEVMVRRAYGFDAIDPIASVLWLGRPAVRAYAERAAALPPIGRPPEPPLLEQALEHIRRLPVLDHPDLTMNRLRAAREARGSARTSDQ